MLDRLRVYAQWKGLVINVAKSEIVRFDAKGDNVPRNPQATAEHMCAPFLAGCRRIRQFASGHYFMNRAHTILWLTKAYALPASMYTCQIWGTRYLRGGAEMDCPLLTVLTETCFWSKAYHS
eukprot:1146254-Pelagomonas_calceolata.AAC.3